MPILRRTSDLLTTNIMIFDQELTSQTVLVALNIVLLTILTRYAMKPNDRLTTNHTTSPAKYVITKANITAGQQDAMFTRTALGILSWEFVLTMNAIPGDSTIPW